MTQMQHSPTPWVLVEDFTAIYVEDNDGDDVFMFELSPDGHERAKPNAERIVACLNACDELPDPAKLESLIEWCRTKLADGEESIGCISVLQELGIPVQLDMDGTVNS